MNYKKLLILIIVLFFFYSSIIFYNDYHKIIEGSQKKRDKATEKSKDITNKAYDAIQKK